MFVRAYLRASTKEQDASRARGDLERFASERGLTIAAYYQENESGASLKRPELFRLLADSHEGDILLTEQVDRLSRLNVADWDKLKAEIAARRIRVVALDLPTSWQMTGQARDDVQGRILDAVNAMMLDMLAAIARKDYEDRRRRQAQGIEAAKAKGVYRGRPEAVERNAGIKDSLVRGQSWSSIIAATGASRSTLARLTEGLKANKNSLENIAEGLNAFKSPLDKAGEGLKASKNSLESIAEGLSAFKSPLEGVTMQKERNQPQSKIFRGRGAK
jgi:DNA invertase Pin-like site-specific DNA recombinase